MAVFAGIVAGLPHQADDYKGLPPVQAVGGVHLLGAAEPFMGAGTAAKMAMVTGPRWVLLAQNLHAFWRLVNVGLVGLDATPPTEEEKRINAFKVWSMLQDWQQLDEESREKLVDSLVGAGQYQKIKTQAQAVVESAVATPPADRTVKAQIEAWRTLLHGICLSGQMSEGRFDAYCRNIRSFATWIGEKTAIDAIDEAKLEGFFNYLSVQVGANKYSPAYAHTLMMTAKQFVSRLAELKLIPMPGNIRSRRFRFNHSAPVDIETFTLEEVQAMLKTCDGFS